MQSTNFFYDTLNEHCYTPQQREGLRTIQLRRFNNARKFDLLKRYVQRGDFVLDLAGGKGGDLYKYQKLGASYVHNVDLSYRSLLEAQQRYNAMEEEPNFELRTTHGSFVDPQMYAEFSNDQFDVVSCQFALHYANYGDHLRVLLGHVSRVLRAGGYFVCTLPNANRVRHFQNNKLCHILINPHQPEKNYIFTLTEAVNGVAEYFVEFDVLVHLAKQFNLRLIYYKEFSDVQCYKMSPEERDIANLYCSYAFLRDDNDNAEPR